MAKQRLTIRRPDDWHVHLRDGEMLRKVAPYTARQFARAIVMPNLVPPITNVDAAAAYRDRIRDAAGPGFEPLGNSGVCIRIGGSVDFGVSSSGHGGSSSVANSADWIRGKPAKSGN